MELGKFQRSNYGLATALYLLLAIATGQLLGWFCATDDLLRSGCIRLTPPGTPQEQLLLVYAPPELLKSASPALVSLIEQINFRSPKKIAIEATGSIAQFSKLNQLSWSPQLTVGFGHDEIADHADAAYHNRFTTGFLDLDRMHQPLYRQGTTTLTDQTSPIRSFEYEITKSISPLTHNLPDGKYGIRYLGGENSIANIRYRELLNGNMLRDLIRDKVVIIGPDYHRQFHLLTPNASGDPSMSRLEVRGNMVSSLLNENYVTETTFLASMAILILVIGVSIQVARQTQKSWLPLTVFLNLTTILLCVLICYWLASIWLPATAMLLAGSGSVAAIVFQRFAKLEDYIQFWKVRSTTREAHTQSRFEESVWQAVGDAASQMFQPTRMVMMELAPEATHLKRVRSVGCDYSQIFEKRLDFRRSPYWDAIQENRPLRSAKRGFFVATPGIAETEYILPLTHGMTTYGIIALAVDSVIYEKWADFDSFLARFCDEMAQLVAGSYRAQQQKNHQTQFLERYRTLPEDKAFAEIQSDSQKLDDLIERVDIAFNGSQSAMATFDIYGRVIRRNSNLNLILQQIDVSISRANCVDVISTLAAISITDAQRIFREAVLNEKSEKRLIANPATGDTSMMMHIKPMRLNECDSRTSIETRGLVLEIVDGQAFQDVRCWKHELSTAMVPEVLNKASKLEQKTSILQKTKSGDPSINDLFGSVGETVSEIVDVLQSCQALSSRQITESPENHFLVNAVTIWKTAVADFEDKFLQRSITMTERFFDAQEIKVHANPILLNRAFTIIVEFLLDSAFDESEIQIEMNRQVDGVEFRFTNQGGGTPVDTLRKSLDQSTHKAVRRRKQNYTNLDDAQIDQLQQIEDWVAQWNGYFSVENLPHCISVSLTLTTIDVWADKTAIDTPAATVNARSSSDSTPPATSI